MTMSAVPTPDSPPGLTVLPPDEALLRARPLPDGQDMALDTVPDDEWKAFIAALTDR